MASLMKLWIRDFNAICPDIHFVVVSEGSMTGIPALLDESADIAPMAREPLESEMQLYRAKFGHEPFGVEVAGGAYRKPSSSPALVFFVNEKNPIGRLTLEQLDAILSTTRKRGYPSEIMTWGELGATGEWKAAPIHLYTVKQPNGIPHFLQVRVSLGGDFKNTFAELGIKQAVPVMDRMAQVAADDRFALSYAALSNQKPGTKAVALAEKRGAAFYLPTFQAVLNRHYPLARPIYFYINRPLGTSLKPSVEAFLKFILSREGQKDVVEEGVMLPLPETEVAQQLRALH
jgi:phosphate transport system substrate-binding protein